MKFWGDIGSCEIIVFKANLDLIIDNLKR